MTSKQLIEYIKTTEKMVSPERVAQINQFSKIMGKLPLNMQKGIAKSGGKKDPYMSFIVEPYSFFLAYEIKDIKAAQKLLPKKYKIVPTSMFSSTEAKPAIIIGVFNAHTTVFWGSRVEVYMIAENQETGLLSWVIVDYETNTNSFDPGQGFIRPTTEHSTVTTTHRGEVLVDILGAESKNRISLIAPTKDGIESFLEQRLWIEGNLSVDYGGELMDGDSEPFSLIFDPHEMDRAIKIKPESVKIEHNSLKGAYSYDKPFEVACFPYAQHYITTSIPIGMGLKNLRDLENAGEKFMKSRENTILVS
jgi:hypothetical protein